MTNNCDGECKKLIVLECKLDQLETSCQRTDARLHDMEKIVAEIQRSNEKYFTQIEYKVDTLYKNLTDLLTDKKDNKKDFKLGIIFPVIAAVIAFIIGKYI